MILNVLNVAVGCGQTSSLTQNAGKYPINGGGQRSEWAKLVGALRRSNDSAGQHLQVVWLCATAWRSFSRYLGPHVA